MKAAYIVKYKIGFSKGGELMRRRKSNDSGLIGCVFIIGIPVLLLMEHPIIFFLVFLPLVVIGVISFINWLRK